MWHCPFVNVLKYRIQILYIVYTLIFITYVIKSSISLHGKLSVEKKNPAQTTVTLQTELNIDACD